MTSLEINKIHLGNCFDLLPLVQDHSIDAIITDPPYGILKGHRIETNVDIPRFFAECKRVMKPNAFIAFFGMMPTLPYWMMGAVDCGLKYCSEVIWCKRQFSAPTVKLPRMHENILIFKIGKIDYFKIKGNYEDIKVPMFEMGLLTDTALEVNRKALISGQVDKHYARNNNDIWSGYDSLRQNYSSERGRTEAKFSSVWSFAPHNKTAYISDETDINHPTVKPIELLKRLVELLTPEPTADYTPLILDSFMGSGTTALACQSLNRNFIGIELFPDYVEIANRRLLQARDLFTDTKFTQPTNDVTTNELDTKQKEMF
jgi:site-specific DNA-methyltransferase (adenine-specific)